MEVSAKLLTLWAYLEKERCIKPVATRCWQFKHSSQCLTACLKRKTDRSTRKYLMSSTKTFTASPMIRLTVTLQWASQTSPLRTTSKAKDIKYPMTTTTTSIKCFLPSSINSYKNQDLWWPEQPQLQITISYSSYWWILSRTSSQISSFRISITTRLNNS